MDIYNETKMIMKKYHLNFKKKFGQNFLVNEEILDGIIDLAEVTEDDIILEIGPGIGTLTKKLLEKAKFVVSVELDRDLINPLSDILYDYDNFALVNEDILKVDIDDLIGKISEKLDMKKEDIKLKVVANIPYYITSQIIFKMLDYSSSIKNICIMVQKEFADRMKADLGTKDASALTYGVKYIADITDSIFVSKTNFIPQPKVDSSVVRLDIRNEKVPKVVDEKKYFELITIGFLYRRKTFLNSIKIDGRYDNEIMKSVLEDLGYDIRVRGEKLKDIDYAKILEEYIKRSN